MVYGGYMTKEITKEKICFIITPIGNDNSEIRRHIDGIIDQSIIPALGDKYKIDVAHRKYEIGSINDRVISSIYEADLVIANLTTLNPNVMFELAIRYSYGKPAIVIAEKGTKLPFDIIDENTIFYVNDPAGANELKDKLQEFESNIDCNKHEYGPVYKAVTRIPIYKAIETGENVSNDKMMQYIIERLDGIEKSIDMRRETQEGRRIVQVFRPTASEQQRKISALYGIKNRGDNKIRVHEVAKELDMTSKEIMQILIAAGSNLASHASTLSTHDIDILIESIKRSL